MTGDVSTLLIANRGEIALRIIRTARAMGLRTVAVYSDADARAPHVSAADAAVRIGPPPARESYLSMEAILDAAKGSGATAIHPGYGFLSENADFARAVARAGLTLVGPPAQAIEAMGDKARAKRRMIEAGVPCVPGYEGDDQGDRAFLAAAQTIGFPIMVKASAGGGGRGMRLAASPDDLAQALRLARSEAQNAFGSDHLILEKAIQRPRHVEIQVFADMYGTVIHLGERDCSVQRRHQKIIEEAPCPVMTPELRERMGEAAIEAARAVGYVGAGTVEFLLDADGAFYFLEMNTRLQVEHPVTEMITGLDLVEHQLRVARGEPLSIAQRDVRLQGHAIEVRLYAEDPRAGFLPSTGSIELFRAPAKDAVRLDCGVVSGGEVSPYYDPMIAKIIAHGVTRMDARQKLISALGQTAVFGPQTNRDFLIDALSRPAFAAGEATTAFIGETYGETFQSRPMYDLLAPVAAVMQHVTARDQASGAAVDISPELLDWASAGRLETVVEYEIEGAARKMSVRPIRDQQYEVSDAKGVRRIAILSRDSETARIHSDGALLDVAYCDDGRTIWLSTSTDTMTFVNTAAFVQNRTERGGGQGALLAPMHGKLLDVCVSEGDQVRRGERLAVLEAMKMQHELSAGIDGRVKRVTAAKGSQIAARTLILEIEPLEGGAP